MTPVFGFDGETVQQMSRENPIEQLDRYGVKDGELAMYVAYAGRDEFNLDAQAESFLYLAKQRCIRVDSVYDRWGHHNQRTAFRLLPGTLDWIGQKLANYGPCSVRGERSHASGTAIDVKMRSEMLDAPIVETRIGAVPRQ